jgi:hypothetical protein
MSIAYWTAIVVVAWVALSVLVGLIIGRVVKHRDRQRAASSPGKTAGIPADGRMHHREAA